MRQEYNNYTQEYHNVWSILYERQVSHIQDKASEAFLEGLEKVGFESKSIPDFEKIGKRLKDITGWGLQAVPGIVPAKDFFEMLASRKFPSTIWIRNMNQLDYIEEPDMFHDTFGHIPLLVNQNFCDFLQGISKIVLNQKNYPWELGLMSRVYWYTVEFGLIEENGQHKIYGAGILSSIGETSYCLSSEPERVAFDVLEILRSTYIKEKFQEKYFVIESYKQLFESLIEIEKLLGEEIGLYRESVEVQSSVK